MNGSFANQYSTQTAYPELPDIRPIGIFWDIENCNVPFNRSVIKLVERIRRYIFEHKFRESEFLVVCDTYRAHTALLDDLNSSQVTVVHVSSTAKNAADDKLKQQIIRFIDANGYKSALLVLTDDINFACVLSDLRNRGRVEITLFQRQASQALKNCADIVINFNQFCKDLPPRSDSDLKESIVLVQNIPTHRRPAELKTYLNKLSSNCGGKRIAINLDKSEATIRFGCFADAKRAQQRIDRQDVFGNKVVAVLENNEPIDKSVSTSESETSEASAPETNCVEEEESNAMFKFKARKYSNSTQDLQLNELMPYCNIHTDKQYKHCSTEVLSANKPFLPMVNISIAMLSTRLHHLLDTHGGVLALNSFLDCYTGEFHELFDTTNKPLVALEHLITCVPGVCVSISPTNYVKRITWIPNRDRNLLDGSITSEPILKTNQSFANQVLHFAKEVRELLRSQPHSAIPFNKFVPAYHTHFVRQLCVGHYGCAKLSELLDEIPQVVQVYGENDGRLITLTHREQTKRFASDLIKVLKSQNGRRIKLSEFPTAFESVFDKAFDVCDYGVCYVEDLLRDVWEGTVIISPFGSNDRWVELPKRDRSQDQIRRTIFFSNEVIELLNCSKEITDFEITFSKFIPCYHRYYNRQCRVSDYGFTKLIELLEELSPKVIEIGSSDNCGEKQLRLNYENRLKALVFRFELILKSLESRSTSIRNFEREYSREFRTKLDYIEYYSNDLIDLVDKMPANKFRIIQTKAEIKIALLDAEHFRSMAKRAVRLLMEESSGELDLAQLEVRYLEHFGESLAKHVFDDQFKDVFVVNSQTNSIRLSEMFMFCRHCIQVMQTLVPKKKLTFDELDRLLMRKFERPLPQPNFYKCCSFPELFAKFFDFFRIEKRKTGKSLVLISLDLSFHKKPLVIRAPVYQILKRPKVKAPVNDIMSLDVPQTLPLPDLVPAAPDSNDRDLIYWSSLSSDSSSDKNETKSAIYLDLNGDNGYKRLSTDDWLRDNENSCSDSHSVSTTCARVDENDNEAPELYGHPNYYTSDEELHSKPNRFAIKTSYSVKKSRIIANLS